MIQLAGHLKGRALQEWNLLRPDQRRTFTEATEALRLRLDSASKTIAAQDFRHLAQQPVRDFIRRLERTFRAAYGRDPMSLETRETLLYGQLQDGLRLQLMRGPAVSGARGYQELCIAAKNEEKHLADLRKRQEYSKSTQPPQHHLNVHKEDLNSLQALPRAAHRRTPQVLLGIHKFLQSLTLSVSTVTSQGTGKKIVGRGRRI